ncbi:unnamed protein product [Blepharisma stoltei]|uniref:Uncharacterized protein n=1 Tax=Blepharisma stoltei TaxID=1481888 RepID=A0AAU9ITY3_9CILI|nr:unnamed protein product [Blepharisma stoltei]
MKQWKCQNRITRKVKLKDFSAEFRSFSEQSSIRSPVNLNTFKIESHLSPRKGFNLNPVLMLDIPKKNIPAASEDLALFSWGSGKEGALGIGKLLDSTDPAPIELLKNRSIKQIACGAGNTLALTEDNCIYSWGYNVAGQLGLGDFKDRLVPNLIKFDFGIISKISTGAGHCIALNVNGEVFSWGWAGSYQTGHGSQTQTSNPKKIEWFNSKIVTDISCGIGHSLVLADDKVYSFGDNEHGQCGGEDPYYIYPTLIPISNIVKIRAGGAHSLFLNEEKQILSCGYNSCGQLGLGGSTAEIRTPNFVKKHRDLNNGKSEILTNIKDIEAGEETSAAITEDGKLLVWGWNGCGQLGQGHFSNLYYPTIIEISQKIVQVSLGVSASTFISNTGELYSSGWVGEFKSLCNKIEPQQSAGLASKNAFCIDPLFSHPRKLFDKDCTVRLARCGRTHAVALVEMHPTKTVRESISLSALGSRRESVPGHPIFEKSLNNPLPPLYIDTDLDSPRLSPKLDEAKISAFIKGEEEGKRINSRENGRKSIFRLSTGFEDMCINDEPIFEGENANIFERPKTIFPQMNPLNILKAFQVAKEEAHKKAKLFRLYDKRPPSSTKNVESPSKSYFKPQTPNRETKSIVPNLPLIQYKFSSFSSPSSNGKVKELKEIISKYDQRIERQNNMLRSNFTQSNNTKKLKRIGGGFMR